jgi:hypothetical protein
MLSDQTSSFAHAFAARRPTELADLAAGRRPSAADEGSLESSVVLRPKDVQGGMQGATASARSPACAGQACSGNAAIIDSVVIPKGMQNSLAAVVPTGMGGSGGGDRH